MGDEKELYKKAIEALESHFDAEVKSIVIQDGLKIKEVCNSSPLDAKVVLGYDDEESTYEIEIQQTFIY